MSQSGYQQHSEPTAWQLWLRSRMGFAAFHWMITFLGFTLLRVVLALKFKPDAPVSAGVYVASFLEGMVRDGAVAVGYALPWLFWLLWCPQRLFQRKWHRQLFLALYFGAATLQIFLLTTEYFFFDEYKSRFNTVAVDYLLYPHEVFVNIWESYPVAKVLLATLAAGGLVAWLSQKVARDMWVIPIGRKVRWGHSLGAVALLAVGLSLVRQLPARTSSERLINELSFNGTLSFFTAAWTRNLDYAAFYPVMDRQEAYTRARRLLAEPGSQFIGPPDSLVRRVQGDTNRPQYNVVVFLEESLGSEFWGSLGRPSTLTPRLDQLAGEGMLFTNMYATGSRTVRGMEGILSSFPPLPGDSIVKRDRSENVETLARVLKRDGYETLFLYGGRGVFDGMRSYAVRNGYERFIEQKDFANPTFTTIWGVCNEDLYNRTLEECRVLNQKGKPFLTTILSVSNHKPYTYPKGRIPEDPEKRRRSHAVKYTDFALGQFFDAAKKEAFWTNTIFVVVADHGARVYGSQSIPIHSYEIPFLVLGPAVVKEPGKIAKWGSQLDVGPTLLGLLGRPYTSLFYGHNLLRPELERGNILINHNRNIGIYSREHLVVLGLNKKVERYHGNPKTDSLLPAETSDALDQELELDAMALFQTADDLYMNRRYRLGEGEGR